VRVFLDTNVLVAAFATRGLCADVFRLVLVEHELLVPPALIEEVTRTLTRKIRVPDQVVAKSSRFCAPLVRPSRALRRGRRSRFEIPTTSLSSVERSPAEPTFL
jgi:predicted nucleic acid-binding protein